MGLVLVLALTALRLALGPALLWMAPAVLICLAAFGSDYYDGVLAMTPSRLH